MASDTSPPARLHVTNLTDQETVHYHCLLVAGTCHDYLDDEDYVAARARPGISRPAFQQSWPVANGSFKCLVMLQPGPNIVDFKLHHKGNFSSSRRLVVHYQPLLELPPLYLAIMVAKDSALWIDCPAGKYGAISSAHSTLDAAIVKLRMTAYMWQAIVAEDFRLRGLGRRSFRLDEEWGPNTTTASSLRCDPHTVEMGNVAKVHVVRSEKTMAEIRDKHAAQQNHWAHHREGLYKYFDESVVAYGAPFIEKFHPVVAGMILDTQYSDYDDFIPGHAASGAHFSRGASSGGLSLGIFGSHTTYAWPRFIEEIPSCLLDQTRTYDDVAHGGRYWNMQDACCHGQDVMLEVIQAEFGAFTINRSKRGGNFKLWSGAFLCHRDITSQEPTSLRWGLEGALKVTATTDHFKLPGDARLTARQLGSNITIRCTVDEGEPCLEVGCRAGLARVRFTIAGDNVTKDLDFCANEPGKPVNSAIKLGPTHYRQGAVDLEKELDRWQVIGVEVIGMNGKCHTIQNLWRFLADTPFIAVPGMSLVLSKRSVKSSLLERAGETDNKWCHWAVLLKRRHSADKSLLVFANRISVHVSWVMEGIVVYYSDGTRSNCGVPTQQRFYGFRDETAELSESDAFGIARVIVDSAFSKPSRDTLGGCCITLENGDSWGRYNSNNVEDKRELVCAAGERIIGFYGRSDTDGGCMSELGIITAPASVVDAGLPGEVYDMPELMNIS